MNMTMDSRRWSHVLFLLKDIVSKTQVDDWLSLHVFASSHEVLVPLTHDFAQVSRRIDSISAPSGRGRPTLGLKTCLNQALSDIIQDPSDILAVGDAIVLVSDESTITDKSASKTTRELTSRGIRLFLIRVHESEIMLSYMRDMAQETGGAICIPWRSADA